MPYSTISELPKSVKDKLKSKKDQRQFMHVVNTQLKDGKSEAVAFASAWAAVSRTEKRQLSDDVFTTKEEAIARSMQLGMEPSYHIHDGENGQAVYMPGASHEAYLQFKGNQDNIPMNENILNQAIQAIIEAVMGKQSYKQNETMQSEIVKMDDDQRIVYGWASVVTEKGKPVIDRQGDVIDPDDMEKAAHEFMQDARMAKAMHEGDGVGEVIHSLPLTKAVAESLGIKTDREGWIIAMKIKDDEIWKRVKSGELRAFSIGGSGTKEEYDAD